MKYDNLKVIISEVINKAYEDFKEHPEWCQISTLNAAHNKNYQDEYYQAFYILKYFPAYLIEHYDLFKDIKTNFGSLEGKRLLSVGCGSGVDYYALRHLIGNNNFLYHGIDITSWGYRPNIENAIFNDINVEDITEDFISEIDVFIFPKSIGNMSSYVEGFANKLVEYGKDEIIIGYTFIRDPKGGRADGLEESKVIDRILKENSFQLDEKSDKSYLCYQDDEALVSLYSHLFEYPQDIINILKAFNKNCSSKNDDECVDCDYWASPILRNKYFATSNKKYKRI